MAIALETKTLLPLDRFAQIIGLHPLHFNQVAIDNLPVCTKQMMQYTWQTADAISREEIAIAISDAERELTDYLGFPPGPIWVKDERINTERPWDPTLFSHNRDIRGFWQALKINWGHYISGGIDQKVLLSASAPIVYSDVDSDLYDETATITIPTTVLDEDQIAIYYPGKAGADEYEIRPIKVAISGGNAVITCRREQLVLENLLTPLSPTVVLGTNNANFLTAVDVYRHYNDPQLQVEFMWRQAECCSCGNTGCASCTYVVQPGCLTAKNYELGLVSAHPATWDVTNQEFTFADFSVCRQPDRVRLYYRAGWRNHSLFTPNVTLDQQWARAIALLALTKMDRPICSCTAVSQSMQYWTIDLRASVGTSARSNSYRITTHELENCPFGTTRAGMEVWRLARRYALGV